MAIFELYREMTNLTRTNTRRGRYGNIRVISRDDKSDANEHKVGYTAHNWGEGEGVFLPNVQLRMHTASKLNVSRAAWVLTLDTICFTEKHSTDLFATVTAVQGPLESPLICYVLLNTQTNQDLRNTTLEYGFHFQHRNSRTFPIESITHDSGRTSVMCRIRLSKGSPNTNS
jgi:hypothetical protein